MNFRNIYIFLLVAFLGATSCNDIATKSHGPIRLGDSSTIVTETDQRRLQDLVTDLKPDIPTNTVNPDSPVQKAAPAADTAKKQATATATATPAPAAPLPGGPGLKAEFKEVTVMIPSIDAKLSGKADLTRANGAVYTWQSGKLAGNVLRTTGGVTKVAQRYQSIVVLKTKNGNLPLDGLTETTDWKLVQGGNGSYVITGINENELEYADANSSAIRNAVVKAARARRMSSKKTQEWLTALGNVKTANQKPLVVTLRSLMWKIDGKDPQGKMFSKQIRIDVPL